MMKKIAGLMLLTLLSLPLQAVEMAPGHRLNMPLQLPQDTGPWYRVELPLSLYWSARYTDLRDLQVINSEGQPVAYSLMRPAGEQQVENVWHSAKLFPLYAKAGQSSTPGIRLQRGEGGTLIELTENEPSRQDERLRGWVIDASGISNPLVELVLDWQGGEEGFHQFTIEASDDLQSWQPWGEGKVATLSSQGQQIVQRSVILPGKSARYLRLLWQEPQEALPMDGVRIASRLQQTRIPPLQWSRSLAASRADGHSMFWQLPLAMPVKRVRIALEGDNVLMPVKLFSVADDPQYGHDRLLAEGVLSRIVHDGQPVINDELHLSGTPVQSLRLDVDRQVAPAAASTRIQLALQPVQLVFLAQGSGPFSLVLDADQNTSKALPITTLIPDYKSGQFNRLPVAEALEEQAVINTPATVAVEPEVNWKRYGLWAVLVIGVIALGLMASSLLRQGKAS